MQHSATITLDSPAVGKLSHVDFLGIRIHLLTSESLLELVSTSIRDSQRLLVANHNLHSLSIYMKEERGLFRRFFDIADVTVADGMSMVALGKLLHTGISRENRIAYNDWLPHFMARAVQSRWRVFYLGSAPDVASRGVDVLLSRYPRLNIAHHHGHFEAAASSPENAAVCDEINAFVPDVLFVGMGMPRQENWLVENHSRLSACVILSSGATLDYIAGAKRLAPRWMGAAGIEWVFRLASEPTRLAHRYLVEPWELAHALAQRSLTGKP